MAKITQVQMAQDHWQETVNQNFNNLNEEIEALPNGQVNYIHDFASLTNGASADGNGLYQLPLKNKILNVFNIVNLSVPKSAINNNTVVVQFPDGTFNSHVRFNIDGVTNLDIHNNQGAIATTENYDNGLNDLVGYFVWYSDK